jgi:NAD(P)-dependent dehydrogenase (short-subunit alcohol dehydrogenase family)
MAAAPSDMAPIPRVGRPADVAELVLWLACDASSYVTGQVMGVDGGILTGSVRRHMAIKPDVAMDLIRQAATQGPPA